MNILLVLCVLAILQGWGQGHASAASESTFNKYINSNTPEPTNQEKPIVNVAF